MKSATLIALSAVALCVGGCATTYHAPDMSKLNASTEREAKAVKAATASNAKAKSAIDRARKRQKEIAQETRKIKDVPKALVDKIAAQEADLAEAQTSQVETDKHLGEAKAADDDVQKDKAAVKVAGDKLAADATRESAARANYARHWFIGWIVLGTGIIAAVLFAVLKFAGKFPFP